MIISFRDKEIAKLMSREQCRRLPFDIQRVALRKLAMLDAAMSLNDLKIPPGNQFEKLIGDRVGQCSIRINQKWRICFYW